MAFNFCIERKISAQKRMGVVYSFVYPRGFITQKMPKMTISMLVKIYNLLAYLPSGLFWKTDKKGPIN